MYNRGEAISLNNNLHNLIEIMAITNITLSQLDPTSLALASAGMTPVLTDDQDVGYGVLFNILTGEVWDTETNPVMTVFGGKIYLPKLYQRDGIPMLQWGRSILTLPESDQIAYSYATANTGYSSPHVTILFTPEANVKKAKEIYQTSFPVAVEFGEQIAASFLSLVPVQESEALLQYVRRPDPTAGLQWIDEAMAEGTKEISVTVVDAVTRKGSEEYGGKNYTTVTVKAPSIPPTALFKLRTDSRTNATLQGPLKFPLNVPGIARLAKKNINLQEITLTMDNIDKSQLGG